MTSPFRGSTWVTAKMFSQCDTTAILSYSFESFRSFAFWPSISDRWNWFFFPYTPFRYSNIASSAFFLLCSPCCRVPTCAIKCPLTSSSLMVSRYQMSGFYIWLQSKYGISPIDSASRLPISHEELKIYLTPGSTNMRGLLGWSLKMMSQVCRALRMGDTSTRSIAISFRRSLAARHC